jgi:uncharacterized protein YjbK
VGSCQLCVCVIIVEKMDVDTQELELKYALPSVNDGEKLALMMGPPDAIHVQRNVYFDTPESDLLKAGAMLRVREVGEKIIATFKSEATLVDGYLQCREQESSLTSIEWRAVLEGGQSLESLDVATIHAARNCAQEGAGFEVLGVVLNTRRVYRLPSGHEMELDRTELPGGRVDVEVEIETDKPEIVRAEVEEILKNCEIPWSHQNKPKYARFLEALKNSVSP